MAAHPMKLSGYLIIPATFWNIGSNTKIDSRIMDRIKIGRYLKAPQSILITYRKMD